MLLFFLVPLCLAFRVAFSISVAARIQQNAAVFSDALRFRVFGFRVLEFRVLGSKTLFDRDIPSLGLPHQPFGSPHI